MLEDTLIKEIFRYACGPKSYLGMQFYDEPDDYCDIDSANLRLNMSNCYTAVEKKQDYAFKGLGRIIELTTALKEMSSLSICCFPASIDRNHISQR